MIDMQSSSETPVQVAVIGTGTGGGTGDGTSTVHATTEAGMPDIAIRVISPAIALVVRFISTYLTAIFGLVTGVSGAHAAGFDQLLPAADFFDLLAKCSMLSISIPIVDLIKNLITIFKRLEGKYPLLTGSI